MYDENTIIQGWGLKWTSLKWADTQFADSIKKESCHTTARRRSIVERQGIYRSLELVTSVMKGIHEILFE